MLRNNRVRQVGTLLLFICVLSLHIARDANAKLDDQPAEPVIFTSDPIAYTGHGALFDENGNQINITIDFIQGAQNYYMEELLQQANAEQRVQFIALQSEIRNRQELDTPSTLLVNAMLLDWLIRTVSPANSTHLENRNNLLRQQLEWMPELADEWENGSFDAIALPPELSTPNTRDAVIGSSLLTDKGGQEYIDECRAAGVPIPPGWGSNQWQNRGVITNEFISTDDEAEVYTYSNSNGVCIALPRSTGNTINLLGIICQGEGTGNACFWDNQKNKVGFQILKGTNVPLLDFAGGADLLDGTGGTCTSCHAGENAFIIHPDTALGKPVLNDLDLIPSVWHKPLVADEWPQNPGPTNLLDNISSSGDCTSCHQQGGTAGRFPELSTLLAGYCAAVLRPAVGLQNGTAATMPTGASYQAHINALLEACNRPPQRAAVYVNDATAGTGNGTQANPFKTVAEGVAATANNGVLYIVPGFYAETAVTNGNLTFTINKRITLQSTGGSVYIGKGPNTAPQAVNDVYTVQAPEATDLNVLDNDNDPDGDTLRISAATQPANGTASVASNTIRYTPKDGYAGSDSFTYEIVDGFGGSDTATVNLTVLAAPQPKLSLSISSLSINIKAGASTSDQSFTITNSGGGTLNWTASESIPWLSLSATSGPAPSTVTVSIDSSGLAEGNYTGEIQITAGNQTETIIVSLNVEPNTTPVNHQLYLPLVTR